MPTETDDLGAAAATARLAARPRQFVWLTLRGLHEARRETDVTDGAVAAATAALSSTLSSLLSNLVPNTLLAVIGTGGDDGPIPRVGSDGSTRPPGCVVLAVAQNSPPQPEAAGSPSAS